MIDYLPFHFTYMPLVFLAIGLAMLIYGGNWTIDSAIYIAQKKGIPSILVGFTIVAFGTSFPELIVSLLANFKGEGGIALGNVIGSNIANILLILGLTGAMFPLALKVNFKAIRGDMTVLVLSSLFLAAFMLYGTINFAAGLPMILFLIGYIYFQYKHAVRGDDVAIPDVDHDPQYNSMLHALVMLCAGLFGVAFGASLLVDGAEGTALLLGVPQDIIALSIIAFGTSVPELSTCIIAARKNHGDMALGNVIGSNVFNILMIIGITTLIKPIEQGSFMPQLASFDVWFMIVATLILAANLYMFGRMRRSISILFCAAYFGYNVFIYMISLSA
jgi:cation:H+ antiporter